MENKKITTIADLEAKNKKEQERVLAEKKAIAKLKKDKEEADKKKAEAKRKQAEADKKKAEAEKQQAEADKKKVEAEEKQKEVDEKISSISNLNVRPQSNTKKTLVRVGIGTLIGVVLLGTTHHIGKGIVNAKSKAELPKAPITSGDVLETEQPEVSEQTPVLIIEDNSEEELASALINAENVFNNNDCVQRLGYDLDSVENVVCVLQGLPIINQNTIINSAEEVEVFLNAMRNDALTSALSGNKEVFEFSSLYANYPESIEHQMLKKIDESYKNVSNREEAIEHIDLIVDMLLGKPVEINGNNNAVINLADSKAMGVLAYAALTHDAMLSITHGVNGESLLMDNGTQTDENGNTIAIVGVVEGRRQSFSIELHDIDYECEDSYTLIRGN